MNDRTVVDWAQARRLRRILLALALLSATAAGVIVLSSQEVADFLREGPARMTDLRGDTLRIVLGVGSIGAGATAVAALWPRGGPLPVLVAAAAVAVGILLAHAIFFPVAGLLFAAVLVDLAGTTPRDRVERLGPRRYPVVWALGGAVAVAGAVGIVWLSVWLIEPLFDEGETLNEALAFTAEGVEQPVMTGALVEGPEQVSTPPDPPVDAQGNLISRGVLMGTDEFHTGSGEVLLVEAPDGSLILRFQDYAVRNGPDLHVFLTPDPGGDVHADGAVDLGAVKATQGFVNYDVPTGVDGTIFRTAVIYCVPFSVTFANAALAGG